MDCRDLCEAGEAIMPHNQLQEVYHRSDNVCMSGIINMVYGSISAYISDCMKEGRPHGYMLAEQLCSNREAKSNLCHPLNVV